MGKLSFPVITDKLSSFLCENGLKVHVLPKHDSSTVTVQAWVKTGWIHEEKHLGCGLSHFLEHMVFQGTAKFPGNMIAEKTAALGGMINAATSAEYTFFYITLPAEYVNDAIEMIDSMLREPLFPEDQFNSEREVILRELAMYADSPVQNIYERLREETFRMHPMRYPAGGYPEKLKDLSVQDMKEYHAARYTPGRTNYVIVGDVEPEAVYQKIKSLTVDWKRGSMQEPYLPQEPPCTHLRKTKIEFAAPQAFCAAAWQTPGIAHEDIPALNVFASILSDGDSSRLYEELVIKKELALDIMFYSDALASVGYSGFITLAEPAKMQELSNEIFRILKELAENGPTEEELERTITCQRFEFLKSIQTNSGIANQIGKALVYSSDTALIDSFLPQLAAVTKEDVIRVAKQYFDLAKATIVEQYPPAEKETAAHEPDRSKREKPVMKTYSAGQRMIYMKNASLPLVEFSLLIPGGKLRDPEGKAGLNRLLADTICAGNKEYDEFEFNRLLDKYAIDLTAEAHNSSIRIAMSLPKENLAEGVKLLRAMLAAPAFTEVAMKREKISIIEDLKGEQLNPMSVAKIAMCEAMFKKHPAGIGFKETLRDIPGIKQKDLRDFYRNVCMTPSLTVFGFAGDLTLKEADSITAELIKACRWNKNTLAPLPLTTFPVKPRRITCKLPRQQAVLLITLPGTDINAKETQYLNLLAAYTSSMGSRLFQTVRNENGLVYYTNFTHTPGFGFHGVLGYYGATSEKGMKKLEQLILNEMNRIEKEGLTGEELECAKRLTLFRHNSAMQNPGEILSALTAAEFTGCGWLSFWNRTAEIRKIKLKEINTALQKLFANHNSVTVSVLPENKN